MSPTRKRMIVFGTVGLLIIVLITAVLLSNNKKENTTDSPKTENPSSFQIPYESQPSLGKDSSPVKIVLFGDFKCQACKQFGDFAITDFKKDYIDTGVVKLYFMNYLIVEGSQIAAMAGESIYRQDKAAFWKYFAALNKNQQEESQDWANIDYLVELVKSENILANADQLKKDLQASVYLKDLEQDLQIGDHYQITETPALIINGKKFTGNDYTALKLAIKDAFQ